MMRPLGGRQSNTTEMHAFTHAGSCPLQKENKPNLIYKYNKTDHCKLADESYSVGLIVKA